jgi:hypothetical protein
VKWYQTDNETRKRYMTWQQEIDIAVFFIITFYFG